MHTYTHTRAHTHTHVNMHSDEYAQRHTPADTRKLATAPAAVTVARAPESPATVTVLSLLLACTTMLSNSDGDVDTTTTASPAVDDASGVSVTTAPNGSAGTSVATSVSTTVTTAVTVANRNGYCRAYCGSAAMVHVTVSVSLPVTWPSRAAVSGSVVAVGDDSTADATSPSDTDADSRVNDDTAARAQDTVTGTMGVADSVNTTPLDDAPSSTAPPAAATRSATSVRNANTCTWAVDTYALLLPPAPCEDSTTSYVATSVVDGSTPAVTANSCGTLYAACGNVSDVGVSDKELFTHAAATTTS